MSQCVDATTKCRVKFKSKFKFKENFEWLIMKDV